MPPDKQMPKGFSHAPQPSYKTMQSTLKSGQGKILLEDPKSATKKVPQILTK